jgi:hypothetical protein
LTEIKLGGGLQSIGNSAFNYCTKLKSVEIPDSVTTIGEWVFAMCMDLQTVTIGNGVQSIGQCVFSNCLGLSEIHYKGTQVQWKAVAKDSYWQSGAFLKNVVCSDGTIVLE